MSIRFGDKVGLKVTEVDKKGRGCGLVGQRRTCAYFTVPGEEVEGTAFSRKQGVMLINTDRVVTPSPRRVEARCPYAGSCGGCLGQQFDYGLQLELKKDLINRTLEAAGLGRPIEAVVPAPEQYYYRNRMDYCVGPKGELGLKRPGRWNAHLDLDTCFLLSPEAVEVMGSFRKWMRDNAVVPWDGVRYTGYARYLVIREGKNTGERMATIVTSVGELPAKKQLVEALAPHCTTIYHGVNPTITDLSLAPQLELLRGEPELRESVGGRTFLIPPNSFFQTNTAMAGELLASVREFLSGEKPKTLLDLYCGVGFFGISLAGEANRVVGVEIDEAAIAVAKRNAELNGARNTEFTAAKAESLVWDKEKPDAVIVDPPRSGLHPKVTATLLAKRPARIVYVSCNYESFARDWAELGKSYDLARTRALDLFPHSPHVELVSLLTLK